MRQHKSYRYSFLSFIFLLLFVISNTFVAAGQTSIGGVINRYAKVDSVNAYSVQVATQEQANRFAVGDTILLIQMKGVVMRSDSQYGGIFGQPDGAIGLHEFLIVDSKSGRQINFSSPIVHYGQPQQHDNFNPDAFVQIIKVPSYNSAIVTDTLYATPWNSSYGYGGVLAFFAGKSLELKADIDVTGKGFAGAPAVAAIGEALSRDNDSFLDRFSYGDHGLPSDTSGLKGEGIGYRLNINGINQPISPKYSKGKASNYSGGGGGNGAFSGGGGGSNFGAGGVGGYEKLSGFPYIGGEGGKSMPSNEYLQSSLLSSNVRLLLGGGGGGSTYKSGEGAGVKAGNGGGIIIIVCESIIGNGHRILANGETLEDPAIGNGGAGGGGAGGSIAIYTSGFADTLITISANGGNGGNGGVDNGRGSGGGGGGGIVALSAGCSLDSISVVGGNGPSNLGNIGMGGVGTTQNDFLPLLNGFLFNSIWSSGTGSRIDSVCQGGIVPTIVGTTPTGVGPFTYSWQISTDISFANYITVSGDANRPERLSPDSPSETIWIRRVVTDTGSYPNVTDISNWVEIIYHPAISGNIIQLTDNTICAGENVTINPVGGNLSGGNGRTYSYQWQQQTNGSWSNLGVTAPEMTTGSLNQTTSFRRVVTSGSCESVSPSVGVTVYGIPVANAGSDASVCGTQYALEATSPTSGSGSWSFPSEVTQGNAGLYNATVTIGDGYSGRSIRLPFIWVVTGENDCKDSATVNITFFKEVGDVIAGPDMIVGSLDKFVNLEAKDPDPYEGTWSVVSGTGSFYDEHLYNTSVTNLSEHNTFQWTVTNGPCSSSAMMNLDVLPIDVPEGLSPNGDGINDILDISGIDFLNQDAEITILNGAGKKIYSTSNINGAAWNGWEGLNDAGKEMPEGTYYYILKVFSKMTDAKMTKSGFIILKRK